MRPLTTTPLSCLSCLQFGSIGELLLHNPWGVFASTGLAVERSNEFDRWEAWGRGAGAGGGDGDGGAAGAGG